jgi:hypothetical protein
MKKYKLSERSYQEASKELRKLSESKKGQLTEEIQRRVDTLQHKIQIKLAMCSYYQGDMMKAIKIYQEIITYLKKFDPDDFRV